MDRLVQPPIMEKLGLSHRRELVRPARCRSASSRTCERLERLYVWSVVRPEPADAPT